MAIIGPEQLPAILKVPSDPVKFEILSTLGHPVVMVELTETQLEQAIRVTGDFIAQYFPFQEKYAYFQTQPLVSTYDLPADAYWVKDVKWDPATTRICIDIMADVQLYNGEKIKARNLEVGNEVLSYDIGNKKLIKSRVLVRKESGIQECKKIITTSGHNLIASLNHKFLTTYGWKKVENLFIGDVLFCLENQEINNYAISCIDNVGDTETVDFQIESGNFVVNECIVHNSDIFGAESFLFCHPGGTNVLTTRGPMLCESLYEKVGNIKVITAFRPHKVRMRWNNKKQSMIVLQTKNDYVACTPNHPISCNGKFVPADQCNLGDKLISSRDKLREIISKEKLTTNGTWSIQNKTGSIYVSALGKEFYLSH